jgi:hypothetical protein
MLAAIGIPTSEPFKQQERRILGRRPPVGSYTALATSYKTRATTVGRLLGHG